MAVSSITNASTVKNKRLILKYGKCPKVSITKVSDKMAYANSVAADQTAPEGLINQCLHCLLVHKVY